MTDHYPYTLLNDILNVKVKGKNVWKKRVHHQTQFLNLLEEVFNTSISTESFSFYPGRIYFATSLTSDPAYTKSMKPTWNKIIKEVEKFDWEVYAPFAKTDPHAKSFDNLDSYQIRDLDHINVLKAEVALMDLNRASHGVGQEIEIGFFMPKIAFSKMKVSRMVKGMPGMMILNYKDEKELSFLLNKIFERKSYIEEPFYLDTCPNQASLSIYKGKICLNCHFNMYLHEV